jgi:MFS family permease
VRKSNFQNTSTLPLFGSGLRCRVTTVNNKKNLVEKSLKYSVADGSAHAAMLGLTESYIVPFALALRATTAHVGLLVSIPHLIMALSQLTTPGMVARASSRKAFILPVVLVHALLWLPILLIPYIFPGDKIWWLIGLITLSAVFGSLGNPAWGSIMADLVPEGQRGRYFGLRGRVCGFVALVFSFVAGAVLQQVTGNPFLGFSAIFGGAMLFRLVSWYFISRMHEPSITRVKKDHVRLITIVRKLRTSNLGRFTIYVSSINMVTCLASPFFSVYMLRDLNFSYLTYVAVNATATIANLIFLTFWGKRTDRAGNIKIVKITSLLIPLVPLLWIINHHLYFLIPVQILSGFAWSGFNLASGNFLYDAAPRENRTQYIALFNATNGIAICLGSLVGGYLAPHLPHLLDNNLLALFLISGILRGAVAISLSRTFSEVRRVPKVGTLDLLISRPALVWAGIRNTLDSFFSPAPWLKPVRIPSVALTNSPWAYQLIEATRSPPFWDDS